MTNVLQKLFRHLTTQNQNRCKISLMQERIIAQQTDKQGASFMIQKFKTGALSLSLTLPLVGAIPAHGRNADLIEMHSIFTDCIDADGNINCVSSTDHQHDSKKIARMVTLMKNTLKANPGDLITRQNVLGLYDKAYAILKTHSLPADWHLPREIADLRIGVRRSFKDEAKFSLNVHGKTYQPNSVKQFQIVRFPDQVVIDKAAGIGEWDEEKDGNKYGFGIESKRTPQPIETGLYTLKIELQNGAKTEGWFLVDDELNSTTSPEVNTPMMGETFQTGNPTFKWQDYISPQHVQRPYENRMFWSGVSRVEPPKYDWDEKWSAYQENPNIREATLGVNGSFNSPTDHQLENGNYVVTFNYNEMRNFGEITLDRSSVTVRSFKVEHP